MSTTELNQASDDMKPAEGTRWIRDLLWAISDDSTLTSSRRGPNDAAGAILTYRMEVEYKIAEKLVAVGLKADHACAVSTVITQHVLAQARMNTHYNYDADVPSGNIGFWCAVLQGLIDLNPVTQSGVAPRTE